MFQTLEARRLAAINTGDRESFIVLFADTPYLERSMAVFDLFEPGTAPELTFEILEILRDDETCLAFTYVATNTASGSTSNLATVVLSSNGEGDYQYQLTTPGIGTWMCGDPHPLST